MNKKRREIWDKSQGKCWYCGCDLPERWDADHFHPVIRNPATGVMSLPELDVIDNLVPSCKPCNNFKHSYDIEGFRYIINEQFDNVPKNSTGMRQLMRLDLVDIERKPIVFWFEKQGIEMPTMSDILGISKEAQELEWKKDKTEYLYFYHSFDDGICTLRQMGSYWLVIYKKFDWGEKGRIEIENSRQSVVMAQAAQWALSLK